MFPPIAWTMTSVSATYTAGALTAALASESWGKDSADGDRNGTRLAVSYGLTLTVRLAGFYQSTRATISGADEGSKVAGLGLEYQLVPGAWALRSQVFTRDANKANNDSKLLALGVDRYFGKDLRLFANYARVSNDSGAKLTPWKEGRSTDQTGISGQAATAFTVGMRYDF
jgi:predicted porin